VELVLLQRAALGCLLLAVGGGGAWANNPDIVAAARAQVGVTVHYDPAYRKLAYPGGDVSAERGVCTDVVVRALRSARSIDLQRRVHEDLAAHWEAYPHPAAWRLSKPDPNIDHRRVPNLMTWFERAGYSRAPTRAAADYLPGDVVAWDLGRGILHIGIVSDLKSQGVPLVIHNIGAGTREEDILFRFAISGHYRLPVGLPASSGGGTPAAPVAGR
jgi:uncharacterized protein YijF (DUF1287 family)